MALLYLIAPPAQVLWSDLSAGLVMDAVNRYDLDLGRLDWRDDTDKQARPEVIRAALAHGIPCSRGIAVEAGPILDLYAPDEAREMLQQLRTNAPERRAMDQRTKAIIEAMTQSEPGSASGWVEEGDRLAAEVDAIAVAHLRKAEEKASRVVSAPIKPEVEAHWLAIGGSPVY